MRKLFCGIIPLVFLLSLSACSGISKEDYQQALSQIDGLEQKNATLQKSLDEIAALGEKYKQLSESEIAAQLAANELQAEKDRQAKEKLLAEEAAKKEAEEAAKKAAAEAEEKKGYNTGITYNQLARTPNDYSGKKVKFTGEVVQVVNDYGILDVGLRIAVNYNYDTILFAVYNSSLSKVRVLEGDSVTIYGTGDGLLTYESSGRGSITIPKVKVDKIEIK